MKENIKKLSRLTIITTLCLLVALLTISSCKPEISSGDKWECVIEHFNSTIALTINPTTNWVSVSKFPKISKYDGYLQFRDGDQLFSQNDTLYFKNNDGIVDFKPHHAFAITRLSKNEMELEYLGILPAYPLYIRNYLFKKIEVE